MNNSSGQEVVLRTQGLSKKFGERWAAKDLNMEVHRGDVFCFLGPNGAGKNTTIRMILTLLRQIAGSIKIFGKSPLPVSQHVVGPRRTSLVTEVIYQ